MTLQEALQKLGLSGGASAEDARRAYHKLLKVNKPEADRDAFIALREAYDCVRAGLAMRTGQNAFRPGPPPSRPPLQPPPPRPAAPAAPPKHEQAPLGAEERLSKLIQDRDYGGAAAMLCDWFDRFADDPNVVPPVIVTLQTMLACHATDRVVAAEALQRRFAVWLERSGLETTLGARVIAMWVIVRELSALGSSVPEDVRGRIAEGVLEGDLGKARFRLASLSVDHRSVATDVLAQMKEKAPTLAATFGDAFAVSRPVPRQARQARPKLGWAKYWILAVVASSLMRTASWSPDDCSASPPAPPVREAKPATDPLSKKLFPDETLREQLWSTLHQSEVAVQTAQRCKMPSVAEQAMEVGTHVRKGNCEMAQASMWILDNTVFTLPDPDRGCVIVAVDQLERNLGDVCPLSREAGPRGSAQ